MDIKDLNSYAFILCVIGFPLTLVWIVRHFQVNRYAWFSPQLLGMLFWELLMICWQFGETVGYMATDHFTAKIHYIVIAAILAIIFSICAVVLGKALRCRRGYE